MTPKINFIGKSLVSLAIIALFWAGTFAVSAQQTGENIDLLKQKAADLMRQQKFGEALPILEKVVAAAPDDARAHFNLGFALIGQAKILTDDKVRVPLVIRARTEFVKARDLGINEPVVDAMIESLPPDGNIFYKGASPNRAASAAMEQGEAFFSSGKMDQALEAYKKALSLDPQLYDAALYSGDVYLQKGDFPSAEIWYQKAIAIDPNRETAYRYSATPLMKQGKYDLARDRYIEAYIVEPYSKFSQAGLTQWAQATKSPLGHPKIDVPTDVSFDEKGDVKINLDPSVLLGGKDDGSFAWIAYGATRSLWRKEKFAKTFPGEKNYRHSLAEEADALRSVITMASEKNKDLKKLNFSLATLKKLNDAGLLEAYILIARPDRGIAEDYAAYLKNNRAKLRQYVVQYVITDGGAGRVETASLQ